MQEDREHQVIKKLLSRTEMKAPADMADRVLSTLNKAAEAKSSYRPLIPSWFWFIGGTIVICLLVLVFTQSSADSTNFFSPYLDRASELFSNASFEMSSIQTYSIAAFGIMLYISTILVNSRSRSSFI